MTWHRIANRLVELLPARDRRRLGPELTGVLAETDANGDLGPFDTVSIGGLVARRWLRLGYENLPLVALGVPLGVSSFFAINGVTRTHFRPWFVLRDVPSTTSAAAVLRPLATNMVPISLVLCLLVGARAVQYLRRGSYQLPAALLGASLLVTSQTDIFIERTDWAFTDDPGPRSVDQVSPYSIIMLTAALAVPIVFLLADAMLSARSDRPPLPPLAVRSAGPLLLGLTACSFFVMPYLIPLAVPVLWRTAISRWAKVAATVVAIGLLSLVALEFYEEGFIDRPDGRPPAVTSE